MLTVFLAAPHFDGSPFETPLNEMPADRVALRVNRPGRRTTGRLQQAYIVPR
jgi:hypothetical protein